MTDGQILQRPKLLLVDDDEQALAALKRVLQRDFEIFTADSSTAAEKQLGQQHFAIVMSDNQMPGGTGLELLTKVAQIQPQAVRMMLSGALDIKALSEAINKNVLHRCLLKPWDNEHLRLQVLEAFKLHELMQKKDLLEKLATTDPVTELHNHRYFHDRVKQEADRAIRHSRPLSLLMIDLDNFKSYNDKYGHVEGDHLLRQISHTLTSGLRTVDSICRYGGDEFAVILPDTDLLYAKQVANRLRSLIADSWSETRTGRLAQTISIGVAAIPTHGSDAETLIKVCDEALYKAKHAGRNQIQ